jgi:hypothetical protein
MMAISSDAVRRNFVVLLAYAKELKATDTSQRSAECREMAQKSSGLHRGSCCGFHSSR